MTKMVRLSWLAKQNILIDESMNELYKLYQYHLVNEITRDKHCHLLQYLIQQPIALHQKVKGSYWLANNFGLLVLLKKESLSQKLLGSKLEIISWSKIKNLKVNLVIETSSVLQAISRKRSNLCHVEIYKVLKRQLKQDEWNSILGKNKFTIADYLERVGISQSTFDRSRGRML